MITGRTVHVVPSQGGNWQVIDLTRSVFTFPDKTSAVEQAKAVASSNQPSQVVLFDEHGQLVPIAHYQLPQYAQQGDNGDSLIEAAVKSLVIAGLMTAGAVILGDLVDAVERDLKKQTAKSRKSTRRRRSSR